jgi:hypothetical protein
MPLRVVVSGSGGSTPVGSLPKQRQAQMSKIVGEVVAANQSYARDFGKKGELGLPPARGYAIPAIGCIPRHRRAQQCTENDIASTAY